MTDTILRKFSQAEVELGDFFATLPTMGPDPQEAPTLQEYAYFAERVAARRLGEDWDYHAGTPACVLAVFNNRDHAGSPNVAIEVELPGDGPPVRFICLHEDPEQVHFLISENRATRFPSPVVALSFASRIRDHEFNKLQLAVLPWDAAELISEQLYRLGDLRQ